MVERVRIIPGLDNDGRISVSGVAKKIAAIVNNIGGQRGVPAMVL